MNILLQFVSGGNNLKMKGIECEHKFLKNSESGRREVVFTGW